MWWQLGVCIFVLGMIYVSAGFDRVEYGDHAGRLLVVGAVLAVAGLSLIAWRALAHYGWLR